MNTKQLSILAVVLGVLIGVIFYLEAKEDSTSVPSDNFSESEDNGDSSDTTAEEDAAVEPSNAETYAEALKLAKKHNKNIFLFFTKDDCKYCDIMKKLVAKEDVQKALANYIYYEIDVSTEVKVARKYKIKKLPTFIIADSDGAVIKQSKGGSMGKIPFKAFILSERTPIGRPRHSDPSDNFDDEESSADDDIDQSMDEDTPSIDDEELESPSDEQPDGPSSNDQGDDEGPSCGPNNSCPGNNCGPRQSNGNSCGPRRCGPRGSCR